MLFTIQILIRYIFSASEFQLKLYEIMQFVILSGITVFISICCFTMTYISMF